MVILVLYIHGNIAGSLVLIRWLHFYEEDCKDVADDVDIWDRWCGEGPRGEKLIGPIVLLLLGKKFIPLKFFFFLKRLFTITLLHNTPPPHHPPQFSSGRVGGTRLQPLPSM